MSSDDDTETAATDMSDALDGSAAAGAFGVALGTDASMIDIVCDHCGHTAPLAEARAYVQGPGTTLRCAGCARVVGRVATTPAGTWLSLAGSRSWRLPAR
jgi:hypothetical protein